MITTPFLCEHNNLTRLTSSSFFPNKHFIGNNFPRLCIYHLGYPEHNILWKMD